MKPLKAIVVVETTACFCYYWEEFTTDLEHGTYSHQHPTQPSNFQELSSMTSSYPSRTPTWVIHIQVNNQTWRLGFQSQLYFLLIWKDQIWFTHSIRRRPASRKKNPSKPVQPAAFSCDLQLPSIGLDHGDQTFCVWTGDLVTMVQWLMHLAVNLSFPATTTTLSSGPPPGHLFPNILGRRIDQ